ncbi:MAG: DUF3426 domain-containing protein [Rhodoferax sp.]|uniref:zinc-ribbon and DUF3426 domain-containing protein n=1 Tax=Rhodoferax sp. TaxID=50421 RepID=UPI001400F2F6|nr:zinc-ribbon and DUF3426 domain-containing protein [Rhodoferax sp.]NDP39434.1 DUF3426 domain-containing protein [Rhodoferax sp.]
MSLITRCPSCQTLFKVVPDQLRISEGWVRCGQCDEVFDAGLHLLQMPPVAELAPMALPELSDTGTALKVPELLALDVVLVDEAPSSSMSSLRELDGSDGLNEPVQPVEPLAFSLAADATVMAFGSGAGVDRDAEAEVEVEVEVEVEAEAEADIRPELSEFSFLQNSRRGSFWRKPGIRAALALLSLGLLLGLLGQIVLHERDRIAALKPGWRPALLALCAPLNCVVSPLRRIDSIVIDSSSFIKLQGDSYRLNFTVRNTADIPLAVSAIELTLTDSVDQPVVRRVLLPSELGVKADVLTAGAEWPVSLTVVIRVEGTSDHIAGYRLLTFYP